MLQKVTELVLEYYDIPDGARIENYNTETIVFNRDIFIVVKNRALKHIVESRKKDKYTVLELVNLFERLYLILDQQTYKIVNDTKESKTKILAELVSNDTSVGVVVILEVIFKDSKYYIKTAFFRSASKTKKLVSKQ